ncbi:hypothetical protein Celaphus_00007226, partial [Cervus elaphus hippelaphus]
PGAPDCLIPCTLEPGLDPRIHYLNGLYGDRNTPWAGGRGCAWVPSWAVWRHFWDHLPISLLKTLQKQWLEVLSTGQYMLTFLFMDPFFSFRAFFLLFTSLWWLSVPYLVWLFLDQDTPCHGERLNKGSRRRGDKGKTLNSHICWCGGRSFQLVSCLLCFLPLIVPTPLPQLVKTAELPPDHSYLLVADPRGVTCFGHFCNFATESIGFSRHMFCEPGFYSVAAPARPGYGHRGRGAHEGLMPSQGALPHSLEPSRLRPPGTEA